MANKYLNKAWKIKVHSPFKFVLIALSDMANEKGNCWPSVSTLASMTHSSTRTVRKALTALEGAGLIARNLRPGRSTIYTLLTLPLHSTSERGAEVGGKKPRNKVHTSRHQRHTTAERPSYPPGTSFTQTTKEPSNNYQKSPAHGDAVLPPQPRSPRPHRLTGGRPSAAARKMPWEGPDPGPIENQITPEELDELKAEVASNLRSK